MAVTGTVIFMTGVTGFLGKVLLEELLRQRSKYSLQKIFVLVRGRDGEDAVQRFAAVAQSECFSRLPQGWRDSVTVVDGDLTKEECGISPAAQKAVTDSTTHIFNCAANVKFDSAVADAVDANITSSLRIVQLAKTCPRLRRLVHTSTAYVAADQDVPLEEVLPRLPRSATEVYQELLSHRNPASSIHPILDECGYPNIYTLTKALAEHLVVEKAGSKVPLSIVRPSIISSSWKYPFPGWIDSGTGLAAFVMAIGSGAMRVVIGRADTMLDIIPVDEVARHLIEEAFPPSTTADYSISPRILFSTATLSHAARLDSTTKGIVDHFCQSKTPFTIRQPKVRYSGPRNAAYRCHELMSHDAPLLAASAAFKLQGKRKQAEKLLRLMRTLKFVNTVFEPYTLATFDFRSSLQLSPGFDTDNYLTTINDGVEKHLMVKARRGKGTQAGK